MNERLVESHFKITHTIAPGSFKEEFLELLCTFENGKWMPERFNSYEPVRKPFRQSHIPAVVDQWVRDGIGIILKRVSNPKYEISFTGLRENLLVKCEISIWIDAVVFEQSTESFLDLTTRFYELLMPTHGFVAHRTDYLSKNRLKYAHEDGQSEVEEWVGRDLHKCISGIYWANWFGPVYVDFFGRKRMEAVPCYRKTRLIDGGYLILTAASPLDYDKPETKQVEMEIREYLGADRFYDIQHPARETSSPWNSRLVN